MTNNEIQALRLQEEKRANLEEERINKAKNVVTGITGGLSALARVAAPTLGHIVSNAVENGRHFRGGRDLTRMSSRGGRKYEK